MGVEILPVQALSREDRVAIVVDTATARDLADAWAVMHTSAPSMQARRPRWHDDVVQITGGDHMTRPVIVAPLLEETRHLIEAAWAVWDASVTADNPADVRDKKIIDDAILAFARQGRPFGANDVRNVLPPEVRKSLFPGRFRAAMNSGWVRHGGYTPSTLKSTRGARVCVYIPIPGGLPS